MAATPFLLPREQGSASAPWRCGLACQQALLLCALLAAFWDGIWAGAPRADQLAYLHQAGAHADWTALMLKSVSWNRTETSGDMLLFRPVLYWLLAGFRLAFGHDYRLWQLGCLALHAAAVLGLHAVFWRGALRGTALPLLLALLHGVSLLGAELVLWNHVAGYLLFSALAVHALLALLRHAETGGRAQLALAVVLLLLAEFAYELGAVLALFISAAMLFRRDRGQAALFLALALLYPLASWADLALRGIHGPLSSDRLDPLGALPQALACAAEQMRFWLGGLVFPAAYAVHPGDRATFGGLRLGTPLLAANAAAAGLLLCALLARARSIRDFFARPPRHRLPLLMASALLAGTYSLIIAVGRSVPRGVGGILATNLYYSSIFSCILLAGLGLALAGPADDTPRPGSRSSAVALLLGALALLNFLGVRDLARGLRQTAEPRQAVIDTVEAWRAGPGRDPGRYFSLCADCTGNGHLGWFDEKHLRRGAGWKPPVTYADALWPDQSYLLNADRLPPGTAPDALSCGAAKAARAGKTPAAP